MTGISPACAFVCFLIQLCSCKSGFAWASNWETIKQSNKNHSPRSSGYGNGDLLSFSESDFCDFPSGTQGAIPGAYENDPWEVLKILRPGIC